MAVPSFSCANKTVRSGDILIKRVCVGIFQITLQAENVLIAVLASFYSIRMYSKEVYKLVIGLSLLQNL